MFHQKCGEHVKLSNRNRTATRTASEFNFGLVFSSDPVVDEQIFQIRIDKKIESWIGSLEIGITACDPQILTFPSSATDLRSGTWVLSGKSILKDGRTLLEAYPLNLDRIIEGELIGVMRTSGGELEFFVNGVSQGIAADNIPDRVFAVVNVYGKVSQVSVISQKNMATEYGGEINDTGQTNCASLVPNLETEISLPTTGGRRGSSGVTGDVPQQQERLRFHERTGSLVKLSCNGRSAERLRPLDEFNNAVVMSRKPLVSDTLFEIRIDRLVEKWSGSIEVGVTTHDPAIVDFPATMTNMRSGTIMMSGCGILTNGKGTNREYGEFNLDRLTVGDRIGMIRKSNGDLHYFINGLDQGIAASRVPQIVWAVVDLYGMTVKVTIVDRDEREEQNLITRRNTVLSENIQNTINEISEDEIDDSLAFHPNCGSHAAVINNGRTAHRPNALDDFNNAVVLTNRPLKINEVFEVRIDKMVTKWAGSIEIGVTTHSPTDLEYPSTMTNVRSGTWIMTGNGVMHNGTSVIDDYGQNLDKLQAGDRVGVVIRRGGSLHFLVNGEDQGEAGTGLPTRLHAVIDLYGQATQATIVSHCPSCSPVSPTLNRPLLGLVGSSNSLDGNQSQQLPNSEIHFHSVHGRNARLTNGGRTASRPRAIIDFNDAVVITNRPLRPGEMFSVIIEKIVDRWSGSIEAGVTAIRPDDLELPGTMTDLDHDTWMLSGFAVMKDGVMMTHGYPLDLDKTKTGNVIGLRRHDDSSLHFYLDGVDQGEACRGLPLLVYPVIDLYGQCAQVSIVSNTESLAETEDSVVSSSCAPQVEPVEPVSSRMGDQSESTVLPTQLYLHKWHEVFGKGIKVEENGKATRSADIPTGGLLFSSLPLRDLELFEICVIGYSRHWAGSLVFGITTFIPSSPEASSVSSLSSIRELTRYIQGSALMQNDEIIKPNYCQSLDWLRPGNRLGVKRSHDSSLHFFMDGTDLGTAGVNLPKKVYVVIELFGSTTGITIVSKGESSINQARGDAPLAIPDIESVYERATEEDAEESKRNEDLDKSIEDGELLSEIHDLEMIPQQFHECHGRNVQLSESRLAAKRVSSYNQGLVLGTRPLARGAIFQVRIESLNSRWVSSLSIGVTVESVLSASLPVTALGLKKNTWIISGDCVFHNGLKVKTRYNVNLDLLPVGHTVGITVDEEHNLRVLVDGVDQGIAANNLPTVACLPLIDLYGICDQVCIVPEGVESFPASPSVEEHIWSETREKAELEVCEKIAAVTSGGCGTTCCTISSQQQNNALRTKSDKMNENIQCSSLTSSTTICTTPTTGTSSTTALVTTQQQQQQSLSISATSLSLLHLQRKRSNSLQENVYKTSSHIVTRSVGGSQAVTPISPLDIKTPPCDYLMACLRLKTWLGLPNGYFRKENRCTCNSCLISDSRHTNVATSATSVVRATPTLVGSGQQTEKFVESHNSNLQSVGSFIGGGGNGTGWAVLPLRKRSQNEGGQQPHQGGGDSWHVAYAKVDLGSVRRILDTGKLLTTGEMNDVPSSGGRKISDRKLDDLDNSQLVISPSLTAATCRSPFKYQYTDPKTKESYLAHAAFELLIRPGSYKIATQTEWVTKESSATSLVALLLRLETNT